MRCPPSEVGLLSVEELHEMQAYAYLEAIEQRWAQLDDGKRLNYKLVVHTLAKREGTPYSEPPTEEELEDIEWKAMIVALRDAERDAKSKDEGNDGIEHTNKKPRGLGSGGKPPKVLGATPDLGAEPA